MCEPRDGRGRGRFLGADAGLAWAAALPRILRLHSIRPSVVLTQIQRRVKSRIFGAGIGAACAWPLLRNRVRCHLSGMVEAGRTT